MWNNTSKFAQQLLDNKHSIGARENIMNVLFITGKGKMMNILETLIIKRMVDAQLDQT